MLQNLTAAALFCNDATGKFDNRSIQFSYERKAKGNLLLFVVSQTLLHD